jgi:chemotaxis protein methyltransferase CheR
MSKADVSGVSSSVDTYAPPLSSQDFSRIRTLVYERAGIDLRDGKQTLVSARLGKQVRASGCRSFADFLTGVESDQTGESLTALIDALTTNYTFFFREPDHFQFLRETVLPSLASRQRMAIWCAAAATGEEPYTLAMVLLETFGVTPGMARPSVLATDISTRALAAARRAVYPLERFEGVSKALLPKYWLRGEGPSAGLYKAKPELIRVVEFAPLNLIKPFTHSALFPVIFCRNVMIYFDKPTQQRVVDRMCLFLEPGGYLFLGHSESLSATQHSLEYAGPAVYRRPGGVGGKAGGQ